MKRITCFVLKVASRCNLNCSYCYMYNLGDKTYLNQPKFMSLETVKALSERIRDYCADSGVGFVQIAFHGGEPLLLDKEYYRDCLQLFKTTAPLVDFEFVVQTNGVSLDKGWYDWLNAHEIRIGISFDGPRAYHDAYRVFHNGRGSYNQVAEAVRSGVGNGLIGVLSVLNIQTPVEEYYQETKNLGVPSLNLLLPDGHYDKLPDGFDKRRFGEEEYTPFADWLIALFVLWKNDKARPLVRLFENIIKLLLGDDRIGNQAFGLLKNGVAVIETNGAIEVVDSLRACYEGITRNVFNVYTNRIEEIFTDELFDVYYHAHDMVCEQCLNCPVYDLCGGGFLGNRFSNKNGFDNPTIYCKDIIRLVSFIQNDLIDGLPAEAVEKMGLSKLSYQEILQELREAPSTKIESGLKERLHSFKQPDLSCI